MYLHHVTAYYLNEPLTLFVWATSPQEAAEIFVDHYELEGAGDIHCDYISVVPLPNVTVVPTKAQPVSWNTLQEIDIDPETVTYP